ncbi:MAG: hypothetical protein JWN25_823, partial [Verrucomicrobiales bacterium]|nr:hypothetical protein [Verrucomicrobiales bacterium]
RDLLQDDFLKVGGTFMIGLYLSGFLVSFNNPLIRRLRLFSVMAVGILMMAQALGRTHVSLDLPVYNTENHLAVIYPLISLFGCAFYWVMADQIDLPVPQLKFLIHGALTFIVALPLFFAMVARPFPPSGVVNPPVIGTFCKWFRTSNLMMSDAPSGVAWYGRKPCLWLTADSQKDFLAFYDGYRVIDGVYLSERTLDKHLVTEMIGDRPKNQRGWGMLALQMMQKGTIPRDFPLQKAFAEFMPGQLLLVDWERWKDNSKKE